MIKTLEFTREETIKYADKIMSAVSLSRKAGKCVTGTEICIENVRSEKAKLLVYANDLSENTLKKIKDGTSFHNVPTVAMEMSMSELGARLGKKSGIACAAVLDDGFVKIIEKLYTEIHTENTEVQ